MVEDTDPHIIGITESWATPDISDAELGMTGYVMFRKDRIGRRGGGVILYIKESIQAYVIQLEKEAECEEAVWCNIVSGNSTLTVGLVYRSPNINTDENEKIQNAIKEVSKRDCINMGKQGKRSKKKHLSKEAIRKIKYKQMMWKTYRHNGSEEDYATYKEALTQATAEIRNSKRSYEQKLAFNIKHDSKSFYAYVRSKQKVQD